MKGKSVLYIVSEVVSKLLPFLLLPYFTHTLGGVGYGELSLFQVYQNLGIIFITMGGDTLLTRVRFRYNERVLDEVALSLFFIYSVFFIFYISLGLAFSFTIPTVAIVTSYFYTMYNIMLVRFQVLNRVVNYLYLQVFTAIAMTVLTIVLFEFVEASYKTRAISIVLAISFVLMFTLFHVKFNFRVKRFWVRVRIYLFLFVSVSLPMLLHKLSFFARGQLDRIVISETFSFDELGVYSSASQLANTIPIIITAINLALVPMLYKSLKLNPQVTYLKIDRAVPVLFILSFALCFITYSIPKELFVFLLGESFSSVGDFLPMFVLGYSLQSVYLLYSSTLLYFNKAKSLAAITIVCSILHIALVMFFSHKSILLVPLAAIFSNFAVIVLIYYFPYKKLKGTSSC